MSADRQQRWQRLAAVAAVCSAALGGCGGAQDPVTPAADAMLTAASLGEQTVVSASQYLETPPYAGASEALGDRLLLQCRACHTLEKDAGHRLGPNLYAMFGRRAGAADGYGYTRALLQADFVWTPRALDAWLAQPQKFLPGNAMAFGGLRYAEDRAAVIASLLRQTTDHENETTLPEQGNQQ